VPGLYVCGETVGGANGSNRLSGNAITEALVFGARAGRNAAQRAGKSSSLWSTEAAGPALDLLRSAQRRNSTNPAALVVKLKALMATLVGPFRTEQKLRSAVGTIEQLKTEIGEFPLSSATAFDPVLVDWLDLRNMLLVAQSVTMPALARRESRGAHQREDYPSLDPDWWVNQVVALSHGQIQLSRSLPSNGKAAA
jgi:succinate dehydrogenase/fumarate reductase flavoprotein subunit